jgi:hypothetical protein
MKWNRVCMGPKQESTHGFYDVFPSYFKECETLLWRRANEFLLTIQPLVHGVVATSELLRLANRLTSIS